MVWGTGTAEAFCFKRQSLQVRPPTAVYPLLSIPRDDIHVAGVPIATTVVPASPHLLASSERWKGAGEGDGTGGSQ